MVRDALGSASADALAPVRKARLGCLLYTFVPSTAVISGLSALPPRPHSIREGAPKVFWPPTRQIR